MSETEKGRKRSDVKQESFSRKKELCVAPREVEEERADLDVFITNSARRESLYRHITFFYLKNFANDEKNGKNYPQTYRLFFGEEMQRVNCIS